MHRLHDPKIIKFNHTYEMAERETMINIYEGTVHLESNRDINSMIDKFHEYIHEIEVNEENKIIKVFAKIPVERFRIGLTSPNRATHLNNNRNGEV